jgi:hypothetical protein
MKLKKNSIEKKTQKMTFRNKIINLNKIIKISSAISQSFSKL